MARYRDHRGSLAESMETMRTVSTRDDLIAYLREDLGKWSFTFPDDAVHIEPYYPDNRIGWEKSYIVTVENFGVVGYTDGPLE